MLEARKISRFYPGVKALQDVSVAFREGEIHALSGENGAGKSTLLKIICGIEQPSGDFEKVGATLFTVRNGVLNTDVGCPYAEKLIILMEGQVLPLHFHFSKTEDIINRGGGVLAIQVYNSLPDGSVDEHEDVLVRTDGLERRVPAGTSIEIMPGNSMTIYPGLYHLFSAKVGYGDVVVGEVSAVNDDNVDNRFAQERPRFSQVDEDEPVRVPLCNEYTAVL